MKTGRFLCVREELRRKIEEEEADESELQSSWLSRVVLHVIVTKDFSSAVMISD